MVMTELRPGFLYCRSEVRPDRPGQTFLCLVSGVSSQNSELDGMLSKPVSALKYNLLECSSASN